MIFAALREPPSLDPYEVARAQGHIAKEADRLKNDEFFNSTLARIRANALDDLATADADDKTMILRLQQKVAAIDEIRNVLDRYIMAADVQENTGSFA